MDFKILSKLVTRFFRGVRVKACINLPCVTPTGDACVPKNFLDNKDDLN